MLTRIKKIVLKNISKLFLGYKEIKVVENEPLVSILLPSYNYANYIEETINSVLNQTYKNWQLIIIDDASVDESVKVIKKVINRNKEVSKKIIFIKNKKNLGIINSYKKALLRARGEYVAFLDADDVWQKDNLKFKVSVLEKFPQISIAYSRYDEFLTKYTPKKFFDKIPVLVSGKSDYLFFRPKIFSFSLVVTRKELLNQIDFSLPKKYFVWADWWIYSQLSRKGNLAKITLKLVAKRNHPKGLSNKFFAENDPETFFAEFREVLRKKFLKMRKNHFSLFVILCWINWRIRKIILFFVKDTDFF